MRGVALAIFLCFTLSGCFDDNVGADEKVVR